MIDATLAAILCGALVGFSLGLIGGGGSILATPLLIYVVGVSPPHVAIGTSALAVSVNAFANFVGHARAGRVWWRCAAMFAAIGTIGVLLGSTIGKSINGDWLLLLFGFLMLVIGALMLRPKPRPSQATQPVGSGADSKIGLVALAVGTASGFFGIGGGFLIVPGLMYATGMPIINAIGSSLLSVGTFGLATATNYALSGLVDWQAAAEFIGGGVIGGLLGMTLAGRLAQKKDVLNRVFAGLIFCVAMYVLYRSSRAILS
jgi:uncharacterized membrane protein YfcA